MKISLVSDLHLEFGPITLPGGELLILAGDIAEARYIVKSKKESGSIWNFFQNECAKYNRVLMVMGNHEHYSGRFDKTYGVLKSILPDNVTLLEDEMLEYNGVVFLGGTLWTDLNNGDPVTAWHLKMSMNDYKVVQNFYPEKSLYHKLTPEHTHTVHNATKNYFNKVLRDNTDKPAVVITHHAPSFMSVNEKYKHDTTMNGGYASNMSDFILDHSNIKYWVHGHMHDPVDYMIGDTRVLCNPRGYVPYEEKNGFDVNFTFDLV
jgi:DNA repair exonuclease SbcCD nuclease subunit